MTAGLARALRVRWSLFGGVLLLAFTVLGLAVRDRPWGLDVALLWALHGEWLDAPGLVAGVLSNIFGPVLPVALGLAVTVAAVRAYRGGDRVRASLLVRVTVVLVLCRLTSFVFKPLFERDRPREYPDLSYPSGHVVSVASTGFAAVLLCAWLAPRLLRRMTLLALAATAVAAACRVVLSVHWFTDTLGAVLAVGGVGLVSAVALRLLPVLSDRGPAA
ncbi:phosphatase PAP2 family protein [Amycolatopsis magusensis]|uniref:phosphatase PAP2 family protein n=1 Tax=Amycolatopsis magusensis TaxID=882444 RepID=UPI003C2C4841